MIETGFECTVVSFSYFNGKNAIKDAHTILTRRASFRYNACSQPTMLLVASSCSYSSGREAGVCGTVGEGVLILLLKGFLGSVLSSLIVFSYCSMQEQSDEV